MITDRSHAAFYNNIEEIIYKTSGARPVGTMRPQGTIHRVEVASGLEPLSVSFFEITF